MKNIWFMRGYSNLFNAFNDIRLNDKNHHFKILCSHENPIFIGSENADFFEIEPKSNNSDFLKFVINTIKKYNIHVIFSSHHQVFLNNNKKILEDLGVNVVTTSSNRHLNLIEHKDKFYSYLKNKTNIPVADFRIFKNLEEFNKSYLELSKKYKKLCVKPSVDVCGSGFYLLEDKPSLNYDRFSIFTNHFREKLNSTVLNKPMLLMQYLDGVERSVDCIAYYGQLLGAVSRVKITNFNTQLIEENPKIYSYIEILTKSLKLNGMFNIQFKDYDDEHHCLEINPRLSGKSYYATQAGLNQPYIAACLFSGLLHIGDVSSPQIKKDILISSYNQPIVPNHLIKHI